MVKSELPLLLCLVIWRTQGDLMMKLSPLRSKVLVTVLLTFLILSAFVISGFTVATFDKTINRELPPNQGSGVNVIRNAALNSENPRTRNLRLIGSVLARTSLFYLVR